MDEYMFEIMMGGINILVIYNMCEDLLLVSLFIIDFIVLVELCEWIQFKVGNEIQFQKFNFVLFFLSYMCKVFFVFCGIFVVNLLF